MNTASVLALLSMIAEGVGVVKQIADLARRAQAGETITDEEIDQARAEIKAAGMRWDAAAEHDRS